MNDNADRAQAIQQTAAILATAYLRLRFPTPAHSPRLDSPEPESVHGTAG